MRREEMFPILEKLTASCVPQKSRAAVDSLISNEKFHYIEPHHGKFIIPGLWDIAQAVQNHYVMEIKYERMKEPRFVKRTIEPVGILFSEYYFYLAAFLRNIDREKEFVNKDDVYPTIYRIDRIQSFTITNEYFNVPYKDRFEEGEFRKTEEDPVQIYRNVRRSDPRPPANRKGYCGWRGWEGDRSGGIWRRWSGYVVEGAECGDDVAHIGKNYCRYQ